MQRYHLEVEGIPDYINMLEDAQKQVGQTVQTIADKTLLLFERTAMLKTEQYPQTNDNWEDWAEDQKNWAEWKISYKRVNAKARVKAQASKGSDKFGAVNVAKWVLNNI